MTLRFVDLFAGIGGFHEGLKKLGMQCVFASEKDRAALDTYKKNHQVIDNRYNEDIRKISPLDIPDHELLVAGFPCQAFSQVGYKKGFYDADESERGNLFFCIARILEVKRPKAFMLENVRNLQKHDEGKTFRVIKKTLLELGYELHYKIIKACEHGRPQGRPRIFLVGFNKDYLNSEKSSFKFPPPSPLKLNMSDVFEGQCEREIGFTLRVGGRHSGINDRHNWDAYMVDGQVRTLTPKEGKRMMGFPDDFVLPEKVTPALKQLGNSVCVDVVEAVATQILDTIQEDMELVPKKNTSNIQWKLNFVFKIIGCAPITQDINDTKSLVEKIRLIRDIGGDLEFESIEQTSYQKRLEKITKSSPNELAKIALSLHESDRCTSDLPESLCAVIAQSNPYSKTLTKKTLSKGDPVTDRYGLLIEEKRELFIKLGVTITDTN